MNERTKGQDLARIRIDEVSAAQRYGRSEHPVSVRFVGITEADIQLQIERMALSFGNLCVFTAPKQSGQGPAWIAYGTIVQ